MNRDGDEPFHGGFVSPFCGAPHAFDILCMRTCLRINEVEPMVYLEMVEPRSFKFISLVSAPAVGEDDRSGLDVFPDCIHQCCCTSI